MGFPLPCFAERCLAPASSERDADPVLNKKKKNSMEVCSIPTSLSTALSVPLAGQVPPVDRVLLEDTQLNVVDTVASFLLDAVGCLVRL